MNKQKLNQFILHLYWYIFTFYIKLGFLANYFNYSALFSLNRSFSIDLTSNIVFQADFFMTYILTDGLSGFSLEILLPGLLFWDGIKSHTVGRGTEKDPYLYSLPYFRIIPMVSLSVLIGTVYAVVAPLLLPFLIGYFCLGYLVFINQVEFLTLLTFLYQPSVLSYM